MLFELYTFNYQRTLFEKILNDKIDDAERAVESVRKIKKRSDDPNFEVFDENHVFEASGGNEADLTVFIELLNILDEDLLADSSMHRVRRNWLPNQPIEIELASRELLMWACLFNQFDLIDEIFTHSGFQEKVKANAKLEKADPAVDMSVENFTQSMTLNAPISHHTGIARYVHTFHLSSSKYSCRCLGVAYLMSNCLKVCSKYITLVELQNQYQDKKDELEQKAIDILQKCYEENYELCLLLIRWKHILWGNRTALELGELAEVNKFMAHQAIQDLLDKVWYGGLEPVNSIVKCVACSIFPFLAPFLMTPSQDKLIDRIGFFTSGFCYGFGTERPSEVQEGGPSKIQIMVYYFLSPVNCFIIDFAFYAAFLGLFAYVILTRFCIEITFFEYVVMIWLVSIQIERMRKFAAIANKPRAEKIRLLKKDKWNMLYGLAFITFMAGLGQRVFCAQQT